MGYFPSFFYEIFYFPTIVAYIILSTDRTVFPPDPRFGSFPMPSFLPLAMFCLTLVFIVEVMCCVTTQVHAHMMPSPVLGYWLPAENSCSLDFTVMRGARSLSLTKMVP